MYSADLRKHYTLEDPAWKYDIMPEIMDGHNVLDFVDPDIEAKLAELEREEAELEVRTELGRWKRREMEDGRVGLVTVMQLYEGAALGQQACQRIGLLEDLASCTCQSPPCPLPPVFPLTPSGPVPGRGR